jgi:translation initiation factor IF-3
VNHRIRALKVRCVGPDGSMLGVMTTRDALRQAHDAGLDLVEVSPNAEPPVCRIMDFGKFRYEESIKRKRSRKQSQGQGRVVKEVKFHANVAEHDYQTKLGHACKFLEKGCKVKLSLQFRGRENAHRELGFEVVKRAIADCGDLCSVEMQPRLMGRSLVAMLGPRAGKGGGKPANAGETG